MPLFGSIAVNDKVKLAGTFFALLSLSLSATTTLADSANFNPLRFPNPMQQNSSNSGLTCAQLDREISRATSYTYNYRTDFDKDPYAGGSIIASATIPLVGYAYPIFSLVRGVAEDHRIQSAQNRIEYLRRLKAERYCYEDRG
jgi:hypothetical protein